MHDKGNKGLFVTLATSATVGAATYLGTSWYAMTQIKKIIAVTHERLEGGQFSDYSVYETFFHEICTAAKVPIRALADEEDVLDAAHPEIEKFKEEAEEGLERKKGSKSA
jgi:hypothetical protein